MRLNDAFREHDNESLGTIKMANILTWKQLLTLQDADEKRSYLTSPGIISVIEGQCLSRAPMKHGEVEVHIRTLLTSSVSRMFRSVYLRGRNCQYGFDWRLCGSRLALGVSFS
jgi:hypothetical protein